MLLWKLWNLGGDYGASAPSLSACPPQGWCGLHRVSPHQLIVACPTVKFPA